MTRRCGRTGSTLAAAVIAVGILVAAGCGTPVVRSAENLPAPVQSSLTTSLGSGSSAWAVVELGGPAASHDNFWQVLVRPTRRGPWKLVTPPGVADNGGLVLASSGGTSLVAGFRPSQFLAYSPLAFTGDGGTVWSPGNPLDAGLANVPDALAAAPGQASLLALLSDGTARLAKRGYSRWSTVASTQSLAVTTAGRRCGLGNLTAAAFVPTGTPLLAGRCENAGTIGIFAFRGGTWRASGPTLPPALAGHPVSVTRLTRAGSGDVALLTTGGGPAATVTAAWSAGGRWQLSPTLRIPGARLVSSSFSGTGAVAIVLASGRHERAATVPGPGAAWRSLPTLPPGTVTVALGPSSPLEALATHRAKLTIWQLLNQAPAKWTVRQVIDVPLQNGSSR